MINTRDSQPHLVPFVQLLVQLHRLLVAGRDEEPIGDELRDEMDVHWYPMSSHGKQLSDLLAVDLYRFDEEKPPADISPHRLLLDLALLRAAGYGETQEADAARKALDIAVSQGTLAEKHRLEGLKTDLEMLFVGSPVTTPQRDGLKTALSRATSADDWDSALTSLRANHADLGLPGLAALRGICWANLGYADVASWFFGNASSRMPDDFVLKGLYLRSLVDADMLPEARAHAAFIGTTSPDPYYLLLAADVLMRCASRSMDKPHDELRQVVDLTSRARVDSLAEPRDVLQWHLASSGYLSGAWAAHQLGETERAEEFRRAAKLLHTRAEQFKLEPWQQFVSGFDAAVRQERALIDVNLLTAVPSLVVN